ncbi:MAG: hypothetical protein LBG87_09890 [Spirochaetaceae bacterium]|jgi:hypothetical protein|nr:hypothetical protein [Spirochaetaceae bacterium]
MKTKHGLFFVYAAAFVFTGFVFTGCASVEVESRHLGGNFGENIRIPVKDFETIGLVFTETQLVTADRGKDEGQIFSYQALLKEAQALGGDAIINVVIDEKTRISTGSKKEYTTTWYGSALAIKYTDTLYETTNIAVAETETSITTTTSTTSVYFNEDGPAANTKTVRKAKSSSGK